MIIESKQLRESIYTLAKVIWSANESLKLFNLPTEDIKQCNNKNQFVTTLEPSDWLSFDTSPIWTLLYWSDSDFNAQILRCLPPLDLEWRSRIKPIWGSSDVTIRIKAICGLFQMIKMKAKCSNMIWKWILNIKWIFLTWGPMLKASPKRLVS